MPVLARTYIRASTVNLHVVISADRCGWFSGVSLRDRMQILCPADEHDDQRTRPSDQKKRLQEEDTATNESVHIGNDDT